MAKISHNEPMEPAEGSVAYDIEDLLPSQQSGAERVIIGIQRIAQTESEHRGRFLDDDGYRWEQWRRRPQNVFFLDGARGSGKTFVLMSILNIVRQLGRGDVLASQPPFGSLQVQLISQSINCLRKMQNLLGNRDKRGKRTLSLLEIPRYRRTAVVLPTIFPVETEGQGACMEVIFASMERKLVNEAKKQNGVSQKKLAKLQEDLVQMTRRWAFSRSLGLEAILSDSINYTEFVKNRARQSSDSNLRVDAWRLFINEFCDAFDSALLVLGIDDTDVRPELTVDILHSLRIYLDHPRIVTVLAGNLRAMRQSLVYSKFAQLHTSAAAISDNQTTLKDWRRFEREEIEQYLEKVLPRWRRNFIGSSDTRMAREITDNGIRKLFNRSLDEVCAKMLDHYRDDYIAGRVLAALQYEKNLHDRLIPANQGKERNAINRWSAASRAAVENFVSWWLFRHSYADRLLPSTVRQLISFKHFIEDVLASDSPTATATATSTATATATATDPKRAQKQRIGRGKRLAVMIFESADNYLLSQRFDDNDKVITEWLCRQDVTSNWTDQRWIKINDRRLPEGSYSYEAICFRIDLVFARPVRYHEDNNIPRGFLPRPAGIRSIAPFYGQRHLSEVPHFGLASAINHAAIPRNCIYVSDLRVLPAPCFLPVGSLEKTHADSTWESEAASDLIDLFGNDPSAPFMAYLMGRVAPYLQSSRYTHSQLSWLKAFDDCPLRREFAEWRRRGTDKPPTVTPEQKRDYERDVARYLSLFTALRYAWAATVVFINAVERSINNGTHIIKSSNSTVQGSDESNALEPRPEPALLPDDENRDRRSSELLVCGMLSQDVGRERYMFLSFIWLSDALCMVPWLKDELFKVVSSNEKEVSGNKKEMTSADKEMELYNYIERMLTKKDEMWPDLFSKVDGVMNTRLFDDSLADINEARKTRAFRHFLLYIVGLHASLPALIHVELACKLGICQPEVKTPANAAKAPQSATIGKQKKSKSGDPDFSAAAIEDAQAVCDKWRRFAVNAFSLITRIEIEAARVLLNATALQKPHLVVPANHVEVSELFSFPAWRYVCDKHLKGAESYTSYRPHFTFTPDISVSTLFGEPVTKDPSRTPTATSESDPPPHEMRNPPRDRAVFCGLFEQARTNLRLAFEYIGKAESELVAKGT